MSSANGKVIYGYRFDHQLLQVVDGKERVCRSNSSHVLTTDGPYCPRCGSQVIKQKRMIPSSSVVAYATRHGLTPEDVLLSLEVYQHKVPSHECFSKEEGDWVFGVRVVEGRSNTCSEFKALDAPERVDRLNEADRLFTELGLDPTKARYYLLVELS